MKTIKKITAQKISAMARWAFDNRYKTLILLSVFIFIIASQFPKMTKDTSTEGLLRANDPALVDFNMFRDQFGRGPVIIVAIQTKDVFDMDFLTQLKNLHQELDEKVPYLDDITSLINARHTRGDADELIVGDLMEEMPANAAALELLRSQVMQNPLYLNTLINDRHDLTTILIKTNTYSSTGKNADTSDPLSMDFDSPGQTNEKKSEYITSAENDEAVDVVYEITQKYASPDFKIYVTGPASISNYFSKAMLKDMSRFLGLSFLTITIILAIMFRRLSGVIMPLIIVMVSLLSTMSIMAIFNISLKLPTTVLPSFLLAIALCDSIHILTLFYRAYENNQTKRNAVINAYNHSGLAILMASITTACGLLSFAGSAVAPIEELGIFTSIGVMFALMYTVVLLPAIISIIPIKIKQEDPEKKTAVMDKIGTAMALFATSHPIKIITLFILITSISILGISRIKFSHDILRWLPGDSNIRMATEKIDEQLKGSFNLEVIINMGKKNAFFNPEILNQLEESVKFAESLDINEIQAGKAWSISVVLKETNKALNENNQDYYAIPDSKNLIAQEFLLFENSGTDDLEEYVDTQFSMARFMIKVSFKNAIQYQKFIDTVAGHFQKNYPEAKITTTGMITLYTQTMSNTIKTMAESYIISIIVISVLMFILIGTFELSFLSMIPNLVPVLLMLGISGWLKIPLNVFTMMVSSIALGIVVDDTIHFMHNFQKYYLKSNNVADAIKQTLSTAGRAMLVTSLVLCLGFYVFLFASMTNFIYFGFLTGTTIIFGLFADFLLAPAILVVYYKYKESYVHRKMDLEAA
ncbi:MAG: MMPL family transporter [Deltaproteobacteria bacterium]|uniref:efflux RND transporter permease subunit n=1 Tax=Desulfobacula sp. TaxID=2593537 RepID=UPI0019B314B6|nr:MMPL family transporter [Candidatus Desulfobacula maris]MBL6994989.1 MMPL family transporter [Desulfobacula sp.]